MLPYLAKELNDLRHQIGVYDGLYLGFGARGNVGEEPDGLLVYLGFGMIEKSVEIFEGLVIENDLSLLVWKEEENRVSELQLVLGAW